MASTPLASGGNQIGRVLALAISACVGFGAGACDDESPGATDVGDQDVAADIAADIALDLVTDVTADVSEDVTDVTDAAEEPEQPGPCPGSIECFDPEYDRPRAVICIQAGYPPDTACVLGEDGFACCVPPFSCVTDDDCEAAREEEDFCRDERFACVCNTLDGSCSSFVCLSDEECEGAEVCRGGSCVEPGSSVGMVARILSPPGVITEGESRQLLAVAVDPSDPERVLDDIAISWESDNSNRVSLGGSGVATGESETGPATITARVTDNASDPGDQIVLTNYAESTADLRVVVLDESNRLPVPDAHVYVQPDTGDPVTARTDALGVATFENTLARPVDVSVFPPIHTYATFVSVEGDDLLVVVSPSTFAEVAPEEVPGGEDRICQDVDGESMCFELEGLGALVGAPDFTRVANPGELKVSLTGFSLGNELLDLNFELILGPNIKRDLSGGPFPVEDLAEIPGGVTLAFAGDALVPTYVVTTTPGAHLVWALGGRVTLSADLLAQIIEQVGGELDIAALIALVLPLFNNFYSAVVPEVLVEAPSGDALNLAEVDVALSVPVARRIFITPPIVPSTADGALETGLFLAGASVPGQGFLPLGITAASDGADRDPEDGILDGDPTTEAADPIPLNMAPIHGGIRSPETHYVLVGVALPLAGSDRQENTSGFIVRAAPGEALPAEVTFDIERFPSLPEGSTYVAETRTITIVPSDFGADLYRVLFRGEGDRLWQVHLPAGVSSTALPDPTAIDVALEDRTLRGKVNVLSVQFDDENTPVPTYSSLISLQAPTFDNLVDFVSAFAVLEIAN